jgi:enamine deaminase RidA (YjgF/YER057c/UK114 family)
MLKRTIIHPAGFAAPRGAYSPGILLEHAGVRTLYATGQLAVDPGGRVIAPGDATAQTEYVFQLLGEILQAAGMTFAHVVRAQTYLTNIEDFPKFSAVRDRYLGGSLAASTLLEVKGLARPGCCVEIEITAAA